MGRRALAVCGLVRSRPGDLPVGGVLSEGVFPSLVERISVILQYFCILAFLLDLCLFDRLTDWGLRQIFYLSAYCYIFAHFFLSHCLQNTYFHQLFNFSAHNWVKANSYYKYTYRKCKFV